MNRYTLKSEHMLINKTTAKILQIFTGHITETYSIREIARILNMHVSLAHRSIKSLIENNIILLDKHKKLYLNYKSNHELLISSEYQRKENLLSNKKYKDLALFSEEVINKIEENNFILLLFGSIIESNKPRDIDILLIVDNNDKIEFHEKFLDNITSNYNLPFETRVISFESIQEMLVKRDEKNIMNEILNKHIILFGAELFYRLIKKWRL
ncbi:hypothetical protein J4223_03830 [Candidatus Woesearchaeota archaeon]|nr:hypothetical protein [Candidatus Woesearchaeota archaeon]